MHKQPTIWIANKVTTKQQRTAWKHLYQWSSGKLKTTTNPKKCRYSPGIKRETEMHESPQVVISTYENPSLHLVLLRAGVWQFRCNSGAQSFNENSWLQLLVQKSNMVSECTVHTNTADTTTSTQTGQQAARKTRKRKIETDERMGACKGSVSLRKIALATGLQARTRFRSCSTEHCTAQRPSTPPESLNCNIAVFV